MAITKFTDVADSGYDVAINKDSTFQSERDKFLQGLVTKIDELTDLINTHITDMAANNAKTGITTAQANAITANTAKVTFPGLGTTNKTALAGDTTTISTAQANAITANTAKTGITSTQATSITDNTTSIASNKASISTNINDIKSQGNTINLLAANKLEVTPDVNSSNNQRLVCGVTQSKGIYSLSFTFSDIDKTGKLFTKTGSIQLK
tara:strand:+ start:961 stop:1587 length:627 start_codon:yes stop_codon:yes gene_type:complete